jgi:hypothetical protein
MFFSILRRKYRVIKLERAKLPYIKFICPRCFNHTSWEMPENCWIEMTAPFVFQCSCGLRTEIGVPYVEQYQFDQSPKEK